LIELGKKGSPGEGGKGLQLGRKEAIRRLGWK
jgi:hypothetical protein